MPASTITDIRDAQEHAEIVAILTGLPEQHPVRVTHTESAETIKLAHLVPNELVKPLTKPFFTPGTDHFSKP
jgi:hypothetical protein